MGMGLTPGWKWCRVSYMNTPPTTYQAPTCLADVDRDLDCETYGHVFGLISGNVRHCERFGCDQRDGYDPDEFTDVDGGLYDFDDPDRYQLGYYGLGDEGADAYVLKLTA